MERMKKAREEAERKKAFLERGIPASKPLKPSQIAEQEALRQLVQERKEQQRSQLAAKSIFSSSTPQTLPSETETRKFKARGQAEGC